MEGEGSTRRERRKRIGLDVERSEVFIQHQGADSDTNIFPRPDLSKDVPSRRADTCYKIQPYTSTFNWELNLRYFLGGFLKEASTSLI